MNTDQMQLKQYDNNIAALIKSPKGTIRGGILWYVERLPIPLFRFFSSSQRLVILRALLFKSKVSPD